MRITIIIAQMAMDSAVYLQHVGKIRKILHWNKNEESY